MKREKLPSVIRRKILVITGLLLLLAVVLPAFAYATSTGRGFSTRDNNLIVGMAASLNSESTSSNQLVEVASRDSKERFVGIVTTKDANSLTVGNINASIYVATSGVASALATDINGSIKKGDFLTISSLNGIVMKASDTETTTVGTALQDFSVTNAKTQTLKDSKGVTHDVKINPLSIDVLLHTSGAQSKSGKAFLVLFGESLTGKQVSQWQVIAALGVLFLILIVEGSVVYGAIHSTIQAIGRNPLASKAVYKQLLQVLIIAIIILVFGGVGMYAILWS